jgi:hypothetical protein
MNLHTELRALIHQFGHRAARRAQLVDALGFGYSRDLDQPTPAPVPDGVDLHFFTGRTRQEVTR